MEAAIATKVLLVSSAFWREREALSILSGPGRLSDHSQFPLQVVGVAEHAGKKGSQQAPNRTWHSSEAAAASGVQFKVTRSLKVDFRCSMGPAAWVMWVCVHEHVHAWFA